jgi:hypothetical protein
MHCLYQQGYNNWTVYLEEQYPQPSKYRFRINIVSRAHATDDEWWCDTFDDAIDGLIKLTKEHFNEDLDRAELRKQLIERYRIATQSCIEVGKLMTEYLKEIEKEK